MRLDYFRPLIFFVTVASVGGIVFWPKVLTTVHMVGFGVLLLSVILTYTRGIRRVLRDSRPEASQDSRPK